MFDIFRSSLNKKKDQASTITTLANEYISRNLSEFLNPTLQSGLSNNDTTAKDSDINNCWSDKLKLNKSTFMSGWKPSTNQYNTLYEQLFYHYFEYPTEIEKSLRSFSYLQWFPPQWFEHGKSLSSGRMGQAYLMSCKIPYQKEKKSTMIREIDLCMMKQQKELTLPNEVIGITAIKHKNCQYSKLGLVSMAYEYSLEQLIPQVDQWSFQKTCRLAIALVSSLRDLHQKDRIHPNLQPKNILISNIYHNEDKLQVKIVDDWPLLPISNCYGRWPYICPEICYDDYTNITQKSNIYSLGIILWQLISGIIFPSCATVDSNIYRLTALKHIDPAYQDIIMRCLSRDPNHRPNADTICEALIRVLITDMTLLKNSKQDLALKHSVEVTNNQMMIAKYLSRCPNYKQALHDLMEGATISKRVMLQVTISIELHHYHRQDKGVKDQTPKKKMKQQRPAKEQQANSYCEDENGCYIYTTSTTTSKKKQKYQKRQYQILASKNDVYYASGSSADLPPADVLQIGGFA